METMRLNRTIACPECYTPVKPFVIGPSEEDARGRKMVKVKCPRDECQGQFTAYADKEVTDGLSLPHEA